MRLADHDLPVEVVVEVAERHHVHAVAAHQQVAVLALERAMKWRGDSIRPPQRTQ